MTNRLFNLSLPLLTALLIACANGTPADRIDPTEVGPPSFRDAEAQDSGRSWDARSEAGVDGGGDSGRDAERDPLPPWEEGESCFPGDPFAAPIPATDLASGPSGGEAGVVQTRNGLLIVRAGVSSENWGIYTAKTDRAGGNVVESSRIRSLAPARDPVALKIEGGFLVAYTVETDPTPTLYIAVLDDEGVPVGEPRLVGEGYSTASGSTFVEVDGSPVLFVIDERPGQPRFRRLELGTDGAVIGDDPLNLGDDATDLSVGVGEDQLGLTWLAETGEGRAIRFASLSKTGTVEVDPAQITAAGAARPTSVVPTGQGWAVVYGTSEGGAAFRVWLLQLDTNGVPVGVPREISGGSTTAIFPRASWDGEAIAVVWQENATADIAFTLVDPEGDATGPSTVSETVEGALLPNVFWVGDRYAVTWQDWSNDAGYIQRLAVSNECPLGG